MCIIVDANKLRDFADPTNKDAKPIRGWLDSGRGSLVYTDDGQYGEELNRVQDAMRMFRTYNQNGKAILIRQAQFANEERTLLNHPDLRSNDQHVLALAQASGARLLFTGDQKLKRDFKNKTFIDNPRGKIYSSATNQDLLDRSVCPSP